MRYSAVSVHKWKKSDNSSVFTAVPDRTGKFIQFSLAGESVDGATEVCSSALIMFPDGSVEDVQLVLISFGEECYDAL